MHELFPIDRSRLFKYRDTFGQWSIINAVEVRSSISFSIEEIAILKILKV